MSETQYEYYTNTFTTNNMIHGVNQSAMTFTIGTVGPNTTHKLTSIKLRLAKQGTLTGNFTISIFNTSGGKPTGSALTTLTIDATTLGNAAWIEYTIVDSLFLSSSTMYAIVVSYPNGDISNYVRWFRTTGGYAGGAECDSGDSGSTWSIDTHDLGFYEYGHVEHAVSLGDTLDISDVLAASLPTDGIMIRYSNMCGLPKSDGHYDDSTPTNIYHIYLHRPYYSNADGNLSLDSTNLSFRSGNYKSYIDSINDEEIHIRGYENVDAMVKFNIISQLADYGEEIEFSGLKSTWDGIYIISNFSYSPIGIGKTTSSDAFEYKITLKFVRDL